MKARLVRTKASGQSLPLIALMIVVLIAMVGLAVDVGNTYAEQRSTVRASNSAAITGMSQVIGGGQDTSVYDSIVASLEANGMHIAERGKEPVPGERLLTAMYLDAQGKPLGAVGSFTNSVPPTGVKYLQVDVGGKIATYFARVVGQNTLPVGAQAFAARGPCDQGVYPIAIRNGLLNQNGFAPPTEPDEMQYYTTYSDANYRYKTQRRIYIKDADNPNGGFSYLRWQAGQQNGNATQLAAMLAGAGNLKDGFDEAPWPPSNDIGLNQPLNYPLEPNTLNPPEWIYGNSGWSNAVSVRNALDWHITNRTVMYLPIFDTTTGTGVNGNYHADRLGGFILRGYGHQGGQGKGWYFDMVYIGTAPDCPVLTGTPPTPTSLTVAGNIWYNPRSATTPQGGLPVQYEVIVDLSGSMGWNFAGQAGNSGSATQCTGVPWSDPCNGSWNPKAQRRMVIAKDAIKGLVDNMGTNDVMRLITFKGELNGSPGNQRAVDMLTEALPAANGQSDGWTSDKSALKDELDKFENKPKGVTPSAVGIARAAQELAKAPTKAANGQPYKRVVVFLTDGVANVMRDGSRPNYGPGCQDSTEIASCNTGYTTSNPPIAKPVTAMVDEAASLKQLSEVYVIALAGVEETNLRDVASQYGAPYFQTARSKAELEQIFANIGNNVKNGPCAPLDSDFTNRMSEENMGNNPTQPHSYPTVGYVYLYDQNGNALPNGKAPIVVDDQSGTLSYSFGNLAPGNYTMKAFVDYVGEDGVSRTYDLLVDRSTGDTGKTTSFTVSEPASLNSIFTVPPTYLDLDGSVCPAS